MSQPPSAQEENPVLNAYQSWATGCPFASRWAMIGIVGTYVAGIVVPPLDYALLNSANLTISHFEVYRLVTSVFVGGSFLGVIFGLMTFNRVGPNLERSLGSTGMLTLMLTLTIASNVAFLVCCVVFTYMGRSQAWAQPSSGFWTLLVAMLAIECMGAPEAPQRFFIIPVDIPSKYYPLFLACLFSLFNRGSFLALGTAVGVGYAYAFGKLNMLKPSRSKLSGWEAGCLSNFVNRQGYIVNGSAMGAQVWAPLNNPADHPSNQQADEGGGFSSFFGGRGGGNGGEMEGESDGGESGFGSNNVIKRGTAGGSSSTTGSSATGRPSGGGGSVFGGSGQTLGGGGGGGGGIGLAGRSQTQHDPAAARAARLAALESRGSAGGADGQRGQQAQSAAPLLASSDHDVLTLQDMGYTASEAREALRFTDGDVEAAASYLSS